MKMLMYSAVAGLVGLGLITKAHAQLVAASGTEAIAVGTGFLNYIWALFIQVMPVVFGFLAIVGLVWLLYRVGKSVLGGRR